MAIEKEQLKKLISENRIVKLSPDRKVGNTTQLILNILENRAMTTQEISTELKININRAYVLVRKMEKKGLLVAFSRGGREVLYISKKAV